MPNPCLEMWSQKHIFLFKEFQQHPDDLWGIQPSGDISVISEEKKGSGDRTGRGPNRKHSIPSVFCPVNDLSLQKGLLDVVFNRQGEKEIDLVPVRVCSEDPPFVLACQCLGPIHSCHSPHILLFSEVQGPE